MKFTFSKRSTLLFVALIVLIIAFSNEHLLFLNAFILAPLLILCWNQTKRRFSSFRILSSVYLVLVIWNILSVAIWVYKINIIAAVSITLLNSLILLIPFGIYRIFICKGYNLAVCSLMFLLSWISIEYFQHFGSLAFPYLNLGYYFASFPFLIQWYEFTGVLGGSLWIVLLNILLSSIYVDNHDFYAKRSHSLKILAAIVAVPTIFSLILFYTFDEGKESKFRKVRVLNVHPNTDCYNYKYHVKPVTLIDRYFNILNDSVIGDGEIVIWPENAITHVMDINNLNERDSAVNYITKRLASYGNVDLISGALLTDSDRLQFKTVSSEKDELYQNKILYNGAICVNSSKNNYQYCTKNKLVPFEETQNIPYLFKFILQPFIKSLGGFGFSNDGIENKVLSANFSEAKVAVAICYEALFGGLISKKVQTGANLIVVILNEGWYMNISAAKKMQDFAVIRAIENRKCVVRSSNDGVSSFINQRGQVIMKTESFSPLVIVENLFLNNNQTLYNLLGEYVGAGATGLFAFFIAFFVFKRVM